MNELQKLCDKVPSFDSKLAMQVGRLGVCCGRITRVWGEVGMGLRRDGREEGRG